MEKENTSSRLKKIMSENNLRQVDILNLAAPYCKQYNVKLNKSDLSQYCSGKTEPNQDKLFILGAALNVSEAWLMGYDVPMTRITFEDVPENSHHSFNDIEEFKVAYDKSKLRSNKLLNSIMTNAEQLDNERKKTLLEYSQNLLSNQRMEEELQAANAQGATPAQREHADNIMMNPDEWK